MGAGGHRLARLEAPGVNDLWPAALAIPATQPAVGPAG
jgi:hypothetical protein